MRLGPQPPVDPVQLHVGDQLRLAYSPARWWWRVQAVSEHYVACVHQQPFEAAGVWCYTVLDWRRGVRGPCNLIGQGWGDGSYSEAECAEMLVRFEHLLSTPAVANHPVYELEVSHRNRVPLAVLELRRAKVPA